MTDDEAKKLDEAVRCYAEGGTESPVTAMARVLRKFGVIAPEPVKTRGRLAVEAHPRLSTTTQWDIAIIADLIDAEIAAAAEQRVLANGLAAAGVPALIAAGVEA